MLQDTITENMANTLLKQIGAKSIETKPTYINTVEFVLSDDVKVIYVYEEKEEENLIYLQRTEPYAMYMGQVANEDELVTIIKQDIASFKDALTSANFSKFIGVSEKFSAVNKMVEKSLLSPKTVETKDIDKIEEDLKQIEKDVEIMASNAKNL